MIVWKQGMSIRPIIFHYIYFCNRKFPPIASTCVPLLMLVSLDFRYCTLQTVFQFIHFLLKTGIFLCFSNNKEHTLHVLSAKYSSGHSSNAALMNRDRFLLSAQVDLVLRCTEWHKKTGTFEKPNKNWRNPRKKNLLTEIEPLQLAF